MKFRKQKQINQPARRRPSANNKAVFSYYARGDNANSPSHQNTGRSEKAADAKNANYRFRLRMLPSYIALFAIVVAVLYALTLQADPKVNVVSQSGTIHRTSGEYQKATATIWGNSLLNRSKLTVNSANIQSEIKAEFSELAAVKIELPLLGRRPAITLTPARPVLQLSTIKGVFYVDDNGIVLARVDEVSQNKLEALPQVRDEAELPIEPGKPVLSETEAVYLRKLTDQFKAENIQIESITLPRNAAYEADVRMAGQPYYLKFSTLIEPRQAVGSYLAIKKKLDRDAVKVGEYIDLRVEEKVFYK